MFSKEGRLFSELIQILEKSEIFAGETQVRLINMYKKVIIGMIPSHKYPTMAHRELAFAIYNTDNKKYPKPELDIETTYLKNIEDYLS